MMKRRRGCFTRIVRYVCQLSNKRKPWWIGRDRWAEVWPWDWWVLRWPDPVDYHSLSAPLFVSCCVRSSPICVVASCLCGGYSETGLVVRGKEKLRMKNLRRRRQPHKQNHCFSFDLVLPVNCTIWFINFSLHN